jgi:Tol biopolymer transport system component
LPDAIHDRILGEQGAITMSLQEANGNTPQPDQGIPARLESWKEIAAYLQRDAKTARKWEKEEGLPIHRHNHKSRSSVYAYPREVDAWRATRKVIAEPVATPLWKIPAFAVTMLLCLVMVGNGVRPQSAEAQQGQTRTLICSGSDCDGQMLSPTGKLVRPRIEKGCCTQLSPDGSRVAYTRRAGPFNRETAATAEVIVAEIDGAKARTIYRGGSSYAWSADGKRILICVLLPGQPTNVENLLWVDIATGAVQKLPTIHANLDIAKVSPDGKYVAFNASKDGDAQENVYVMASDGSGETVVFPSAAYQEPIGWMPDSKHLVYAQYGASVGLWAVSVANGKVQGPAFNMHMEFGKGTGFLGATRAGSIYFRTLSSTSDIFTATMDTSTGKVTSAPTPVPVERAGANTGPRWAPDSRRLGYAWAQSVATSATSRPNDSRELSVYSFDTGKTQRVASQAKLATGAYCWSSDGGSILFNSGENPRRPEAVRFNLSTSQITPLFPGATPFSLRYCSGDLGAGLASGGIKVRNLVNGSEKDAYRIAPNSGTVLPVLSHDGRSVAFIVPGPGPAVLHVVSSDGGPVRDLVSASAPAELQALWGATWSPDDRFVYFARRPDGKSPYELLRVPAAGGTAESMGLKVEDLRDLDIAPDGTRIAFSIGAVNRPEIWAIKGFLPAK